MQKKKSFKLEMLRLEGRGNGESPWAQPLALLSSLSSVQLYYQHHVVHNLHQLWNQYRTLSANSEEAQPGAEEHLSSKLPMTPSAHLEKASSNVDSTANSKGPVWEPQLSRHESEAHGDSRDHATFQKPGAGTRASNRKSIMEEILVECPDVESTRSLCELPGAPLPEWNLCLKEFRRVCLSPGRD